MTKNSPHGKLSFCILVVCWLSGCASPPPVKLEANSKPLDQPSPSPAGAQIANQSANSEAYLELMEKESREIHEDECIYFALGSSTIGNKEKHKINAIAQRLHDDKSLVVTVIGHANDNGSSSFNLAVSDSRVIVVTEHLRKLGVQKSQIRKVALGSERTPKNCRSSECRQASRRVEFVFTKQR